MAFSQETKNAAFRRAGGRCECQMQHCGHRGRCNKPLGSIGRRTTLIRCGWRPRRLEQLRGYVQGLPPEYAFLRRFLTRAATDGTASGGNEIRPRQLVGS
jgi:hypothetical protein